MGWMLAIVAMSPSTSNTSRSELTPSLRTENSSRNPPASWVTAATVSSRSPDSLVPKIWLICSATGWAYWRIVWKAGTSTISNRSFAAVLGLGAGAILVAQRPSFWIEFGGRVAKALLPLAWRYVSKRMPPEEEAAWRGAERWGRGMSG
jgi:hypothetical protein